MSRDDSKSGNHATPGAAFLRDNPLFNYLIDLQQRRVALVDTLAPRRHIIWQLAISISIAGLWLLDIMVPPDALLGLPSVLVILLTPMMIAAGAYLAGWHAQMIAVRCYPSPLDYPRALELLLSTPLTEKEIVSGTVAAHLFFPFIGFSFRRSILWIFNIILMALFVYSAGQRGTLPFDILTLALKFYLPALCVFIFFPILTAFDMLMVPSGCVRDESAEYSNESRRLITHTGRLPVIAMACVLMPVIWKINQPDPANYYSVEWIAGTVCPTIIMLLTVLSMLLMLILPSHLSAVRRG